LTDGYAAYASYAKKVGIAHALCWSHSRREFVEAQTTAPTGMLEGLRRISALYSIEDDIRELGLLGEAKKLPRLTHSKPHVDTFFPSSRGWTVVSRTTGEIPAFDAPGIPVGSQHAPY